MARPSIFSNEYERQMKRRRKKISIVILVLVIASAAIAFVKIKGNVYKYINNNISFLYKNKSIKIPEKNESKINNSVDKKNIITKSSDTSNKEVNNDKIYTIKIDDKDIKILYNDNNGDKKIKSVDLNSLDGEYNINPSQNVVLVYSKMTQTMNLIDLGGNKQDISYNTYVSTSGNSFTRENQLKVNPSYIWCSSPKFMDDDNIVFVSQVPWFDNRQNKYIWKYSLKDKSYINTNLTGTDVRVNSITDKGIEIVIDGNTQYLKSDGSITK